jgi:hypothetical protein
MYSLEFLELVEHNFVEVMSHSLTFHCIVVVGPYQSDPESFQSFKPIIMSFYND